MDGLSMTATTKPQYISGFRISSLYQNIRWLLILLKLIAVAGISLSLFSCEPNYPEEIQLIHKKISSGEKKEALRKAKELFSSLEEKYFIALDTDRKNRQIQRSLDGSTVAWTQDETLFIRSINEEGDFETKSLDIEFTAEEIKLSTTGKLALVARYIPVKLATEISSGKDSSKTKKSLPPPDCEFQVFAPATGVDSIYSGQIQECLGFPAVSEDGKWLYYVTSKGLHRTTIDQEHFGLSQKITGEMIASLSTFKPKYSKLKNKFTILDFPENQLIIFHGAAGYYKMYFTDTSTTSINKMSGFYSKPSLMTTAYQLTPEKDADDNIILKQPEKITTYVYRGTTGKYELAELYGQKPPKHGKDFDAPPLMNPQYIHTKKAFLTSVEGTMSLWDPTGESHGTLPMYCRHFFAYQEGILCERENFGLYLRIEPMMDTEKELTEIIDDLSFQDQTQGSKND